MSEKSATLAINEQMQEYVRNGVPVINLGFGEAGLPVLPVLRDLVAAHSALNAYPAVQGAVSTRRAIAGYFQRRSIPADADLCLLAPGSKAILYGLLASIPGDLVLARPSWVSYAAQAEHLHKNVIWCQAPASAGGIPDPQLLPSVLEEARRSGFDPRVMILTSPDNPSGTVASAEQLRALATTAESQDLVVISDEIYRDLAYDQAGYTSVAELIPDRTVVTTGLSKSLALGGWRLGVARFPATADGQALHDRFIALASELWSGTSILLEPVVEYAFNEYPDVVRRITRSRHLHSTVSHAIYQIFRDAGAAVREPTGGFYLYPNLAGTGLARRLGAHTDGQLSATLMDRFRIATLPGSAFGDLPERIGLRIVTSMLYGISDEQRLATLDAGDPLSRPSVSQGLERIREVVLSDSPS